MYLAFLRNVLSAFTCRHSRLEGLSERTLCSRFHAANSLGTVTTASIHFSRQLRSISHDCSQSPVSVSSGEHLINSLTESGTKRHPWVFITCLPPPFPILFSMSNNILKSLYGLRRGYQRPWPKPYTKLQDFLLNFFAPATHIQPHSPNLFTLYIKNTNAHSLSLSENYRISFSIPLLQLPMRYIYLNTSL